MEKKLLVATHNPGKAAVFARLLADLPIRCLTLADVGVTDDVAETGTTFADNAVLKAQSYARETGLLTLADDSGLEVDALGGAPGVLSARYGGPGLNDRERYELLLSDMEGVPQGKRAARFRCVIALAGPDGTLLGLGDGACEGRILTSPRGEGGFGYDPIFFVSGEGATMAELRARRSQVASHRTRALAALMPRLRQLLSLPPAAM